MIRLTTNKALLESKTTISMLNYGPNGSGKTYMIGTVPNPYNLFTERAAYGLAMKGFPVKGAVVETFEELRTEVKAIVDGKAAVGFDSICLDSLSELSGLVIKSVLGADREPKGMSEWYHIKEQLKRFLIRELINPIVDVIHKNLYVTARAAIVTDEDTKVVAGVPETIGQLAYLVRGLFDICVYSETRKRSIDGEMADVWELHTRSKGFFFAKDTLDLCNSIEEPDFGAILKKFQTKKAEMLKDSSLNY